MILPQTYIGTLIVMIVGLLCVGLWANTYKLAGKLRFELYYVDFAIGLGLAAVIFALTFGNLGYDGFSLMDDVMQVHKRQWLDAFGAGVIFNLANMLLVAAISVAGMAVAYPVGIGLALVIGVVWTYIIKPQGNPVLLFGGAAIILLAIILDAFAYKAHTAARLEHQAKAGLLKTSAPKVSLKGVILSLVSGVLMGSFYPLVEMGKAWGVGMGPYAIGFVFALGIFTSTFVFNLFFMNLPVQGEPVEVLEYIREGTWKQHLLGVAGGVIWFTGGLANFVAASAEPQAKVGPAVSYALGQGAVMISVLWGLLLWKEFSGADFRVKNLLYVMMALFIFGLGMVSVASR